MRKMMLVSTLLAAASMSLALPARATEDEDESWPQMMMGDGCGMMGMMGPGMMRHGHMGRWWRFGAEVDGRLAYIKSELEITDAQEDAWKGYAAAVKARVASMQTARQALWNAMEKGGALERMDARVSAMEAMLDSLKAAKPALEKLYGALSDDQKKIADDVIGAGCGAL
jgi:hypothetical protein